MAGTTNRAKYRIHAIVYRNAAPPTNFYLALCTDAAAPDADTNTMAELTEIAAGNGYGAGGLLVNRNAVDFDSLVEDDVNDRSELQLRDFVWTAAGGQIPSGGAGARYAVLTDDNAMPANREIWHWWDFGGDYQVSDGRTLTFRDGEMRITEP